MTPLEGALDEALLEAAGGLEARRLMGEFPFQLGILRPGEIAAPDEVEAGHPCWFSAPRFAKAAGVALVERHPEALGYDVTKVSAGGHYRTVATVLLRDPDAQAEQPDVERACLCPDDCNCHYPWRANYCGCKGHA